ncbi:MAG: hypothetical protein OS130_06885 [Thermodesulfobacteriota bacterium]|jgi:hypothetical protein|nr:MAG: hypothetical protein OS130_06885 [Thermodesulfobacteriota bacterium]
MELKKKSRIVGEFHGWDLDNVYELVDGSKWQQVRYKYKYKYKYRPRAKILKDGSKYMLEVEGMNEMIQVRKID